MLIVFDVDGTLIGGEETDWRSFDDAVNEVTGIALTDLFWHNIQEVGCTRPAPDTCCQIWSLLLSSES